jgi:hypothetical protein
MYQCRLDRQYSQHVCALWLMAIVGALLDTPVRAETFESEWYGYAIDVPAGWSRVDVRPIGAFGEGDASFSLSGAPMVEALFQADATAPAFAHPYLIVQVIPNEAFGVERQLYDAELRAVMSSLTEGDSSADVYEQLSPASQSLTGAGRVEAPRFDSVTRRFRWGFVATNGTNEQVFADAIGAFCRFGCVQAVFYSDGAQSDEMAVARSRTFASLRFTPGQAYQEDLAVPSFFSTMGAMIGVHARPSDWRFLSLVGLVGLVGWRVARRRRTRKRMKPVTTLLRPAASLEPPAPFKPEMPKPVPKRIPKHTPKPSYANLFRPVAKDRYRQGRN